MGFSNLRGLSRRRVTVAALLLIVGITTLGPAAMAGTSPLALWSVPVPDSAGGFPEATPQGDVFAHSMRSPGQTSINDRSALQKLTAGGSPIWSVPTTAAQQPTNWPSVTDAAGNTYVDVEGTDGHHLESFDSSGAVRWMTPALSPSSCCEYIALGWNGDVYTSAREFFPTNSHVLGFDEQTGTRVLDIPRGDVTGLSSYSGGLVVVDGATDVAYYSYEGTLLNTYGAGAGLGGGEFDFTSTPGANGAVFLAGHATNSFGTPLSAVKITPSGVAWTWTSPVNGSGSELAATPDGGLIVGSNGSPGSVSSISSISETRWTYTPQAPSGDFFSEAPPVTDTNGTVVIPFVYRYQVAAFTFAYGVHIEFLSASAASPALPAVDLQDDNCSRTLYGPNSVDVLPNTLLVGLWDYCSNGSVDAFSAPGLGANYRLSFTTPPGHAIPPTLVVTPKTGSNRTGDQHLLTAQIVVGSAPQSGIGVTFTVNTGPCEGESGSATTDVNGDALFSYTCKSPGTDTITASALVNQVTVSDTATELWLGRYVVFGDSVPYGHGLVDPKQNQPPSTLAYPELVQEGIPGLAPLSYRPDSCTLTGDQLAVSGAPSIASTLIGGDGGCGDSVFPQEVTAAGLLRNPPALVTIQAGADDIRFSSCLTALLGIPGTGGDNCASGKDPNFKLTKKVQDALSSLRSGLTATIHTIHNDAPHAQIILVDYYQIIPEPGAQIVNETNSVTCSYLETQSLRHGFAWRVEIRDEADFIQGQLNSTIESVASAYPDVQVVDVSQLFLNHEMCTPTSNVFDGYSLTGTSTAGHPTAAGQRMIAESILTDCAELPRKCIGR